VPVPRRVYNGEAARGSPVSFNRIMTKSHKRSGERAFAGEAIQEKEQI
jgi:hypothetical protein